MLQQRISNQSVISAFEAFRTSLVETGFSHSWNLYYRHGQFVIGPEILLDVEHLGFEVTGKTDGKNTWQFRFDTNIPDYVHLPSFGEGNWRPATFGVDGLPGALFGNLEARDWLLANTPLRMS